MTTPPAGGPKGESTADLVDWRVQDPALFSSIEWHLLKSELTPAQGRCLEKHGWFDLTWRAQWLVLRVHAARFPTVEAFQLEMNAGYLCSFEIRDALLPSRAPAAGAGIENPVSCARRVVEAHRRGVLKTLLEASKRVMP